MAREFLVLTILGATSGCAAPPAPVKLTTLPSPGPSVRVPGEVAFTGPGAGVALDLDPELPSFVLRELSEVLAAAGLQTVDSGSEPWDLDLQVLVRVEAAGNAILSGPWGRFTGAIRLNNRDGPVDTVDAASHPSGAGRYHPELRTGASRLLASLANELTASPALQRGAQDPVVR